MLSERSRFSFNAPKKKFRRFSFLWGCACAPCYDESTHELEIFNWRIAKNYVVYDYSAIGQRCVEFGGWEGNHTACCWTWRNGSTDYFFGFRGVLVRLCLFNKVCNIKVEYKFIAEHTAITTINSDIMAFYCVANIIWQGLFPFLTDFIFCRKELCFFLTYAAL